MILCSGVLFVGYGAHVTPRIFQENFIDVMVNIDRIDREVGIPLVGVMMRRSALQPSQSDTIEACTTPANQRYL